MTPYERSLFIYGPDDEPACRISQQLWDEVQRAGSQRRGCVRAQEPWSLDDLSVARPGSLKNLTTEFMDLEVGVWAHPRHLSYYVAQFKSQEDAQKFLKWHPQLKIELYQRTGRSSAWVGEGGVRRELPEFKRKR